MIEAEKILEGIHIEDVVKNLDNDTYTKEVILHSLAYLERMRGGLFVSLIKRYHPKYYIPDSMWGEESVASFSLILDLKLNEVNQK